MDKREKWQKRRKTSQNLTDEVQGTAPLIETAELAAATGGKINVTHHIFSELCGWEKKRKFQKSIVVMLKTSVNNTDYEYFGRNFSDSQTEV